VGETREGRVSAEGEMQSKLDELISEMIDRGITLREAMSEFEKRFILKVLERNGKRMIHAAKVLGIHRNTLRNRLKALHFKKR